MTTTTTRTRRQRQRRRQRRQWQQEEQEEQEEQEDAGEQEEQEQDENKEEQQEPTPTKALSQATIAYRLEGPSCPSSNISAIIRSSFWGLSARSWSAQRRKELRIFDSKSKSRSISRSSRVRKVTCGVLGELHMSQLFTTNTVSSKVACPNLYRERTRNTCGRILSILSTSLLAVIGPVLHELRLHWCQVPSRREDCIDHRPPVPDRLQHWGVFDFINLPHVFSMQKVKSHFSCFIERLRTSWSQFEAFVHPSWSFIACNVTRTAIPISRSHSEVPHDMPSRPGK